jgi:hypothetical protein
MEISMPLMQLMYIGIIVKNHVSEASRNVSNSCPDLSQNVCTCGD